MSTDDEENSADQFSQEREAKERIGFYLFLPKHLYLRLMDRTNGLANRFPNLSERTTEVISQALDALDTLERQGPLEPPSIEQYPAVRGDLFVMESEEYGESVWYLCQVTHAGPGGEIWRYLLHNYRIGRYELYSDNYRLIPRQCIEGPRAWGSAKYQKIRDLEGWLEWPGLSRCLLLLGASGFSRFALSQQTSH